MVTLKRSAVIPLAVVVFAVTLTEPSSLVRSGLLILGVSAVGLALLAATSWWQTWGQSRAEASAGQARRIAADDAADKLRMDSDAG
jgi:protein-S-isoprenylcysteine O-methyltransferase Ste14